MDSEHIRERAIVVSKEILQRIPLDSMGCTPAAYWVSSQMGTVTEERLYLVRVKRKVLVPVLPSSS